MIDRIESSAFESDGSAATTIVGGSESIRRAVALARKFASSQLPILLVGDTGTGKELFAQEIHRWSGRSGRFVDINCGALPRDLVEGELFGHKRGAYTGASEDSAGLVSQADGGTLFLDEVSNLPPEGQAKLLRAVETREVRRLGDPAKRRVDFRLISAVQRDLARGIRDGGFRSDLFQRLAGIVITLPPLSERAEDIVTLAEYFANLGQKQLGPGVKAVLERHSWPGNVRELRSAIDRAMILEEESRLGSVAVAEAIDLGLPPHDAAEPSSTVEYKQLMELGHQTAWNRHQMAEALGMSVATLYRRLRESRISLRRAALLGGTVRSSSVIRA
jgi:transcriptional regulator with PAS, ATPase and Fis domain